MSSLANQQQNLSFPGLLQVPGGITSTLQQVQDGNGNPTGLSLSSAGASVTTSSTFVASKNGTAITGTIPRLISDGFGDYVSVIDFGADPTGAADSTAAFQAAVNNSSVVFVPNGTFLIAGSITMPYGVKIQGVSDHATIRATNTQVVLGGGSIIYVTSLTASPFVYYSGNSFSGLTFYYPYQLRSSVTPQVYPPTFSPNITDLTEVIANVMWTNCQFVNSYIMIDAFRGHLDFEYADIVGYPIYRGIRADGCGGTDIYRNISLSYYYFCRFDDPIATWSRTNSIGYEIGRSDAFHMTRIYAGNLNVGIRFFYSSLNAPGGAYGSIIGCSFDGNTHSIYSESTHPIGVNIVDFMSNAVTDDLTVAPLGTTTSIFQITGFALWGAKPYPINIHVDGSVIKLDNGIISTATSAAIQIAADGCSVSVNNVRFADSTATPITTLSYTLGNLIFTNNQLNAETSFASTFATFTIISNNARGLVSDVALASTIDLTNKADRLYITGSSSTHVTTILGGYSGRIISFNTQGGAIFNSGGNITGTPTGTLLKSGSLMYSGTNWIFLSSEA